MFINPETLARLTRQFGLLYIDRKEDSTAEEGRMAVRIKGWSPLGPDSFTEVTLHGEGGLYELDVEQARQLQQQLQGAWRGNAQAFQSLLEMEPKAITSSSEFRQDGLHISGNDLWTYIRAAFLRDHADEQTTLCARKDCETPYFVKKKKRQIYCSDRCRVSATVRKYRKRQEEAKKAGKRAKGKKG